MSGQRGIIRVSQRMKDPILEALEEAGIEPLDVHIDVGDMTIELEIDDYIEAMEVLRPVLLEGF